MKKILKVLEKVQREVVLIGGAVITIGEVLVSVLPAGTVQTVLRIALPVVVTVVQRTRTIPLPVLEAVVAKLQKPA